MRRSVETSRRYARPHLTCTGFSVPFIAVKTGWLNICLGTTSTSGKFTGPCSSRDLACSIWLSSCRSPNISRSGILAGGFLHPQWSIFSSFHQPQIRLKPIEIVIILVMVLLCRMIRRSIFFGANYLSICYHASLITCLSIILFFHLTNYYLVPSICIIVLVRSQRKFARMRQVLSPCLSVCPHVTTWKLLNILSWFFMFGRVPFFETFPFWL